VKQPIDIASAIGPSPEGVRVRADLVRRLREFFWKRGFIEVETPLLSDEIIPELHIEPMRVEGEGYLQASPEMHMKRLLASGVGKIFQVTRSFRAGERGPLHNPEFTIVEWYRVGDDMAAGMDLLDELMHALLGIPPAKRTTYAEAFQRSLGLCPFTAATEDLSSEAVKVGWVESNTFEHRNRRRDQEYRDELLNFLLATRIESQLGAGRPELLYHYPRSQASLSKTVESPQGHEVAERFELYFRGIELANGFHELADGAELRRRLEEVNTQRTADGRPALPLPTLMLTAMESPGLPACSGCALGFDRLVMLACDAQTIDEVRIQ
jgi:lysyl-tRNA synthetase class 2